MSEQPPAPHFYRVGGAQSSLLKTAARSYARPFRSCRAAAHAFLGFFPVLRWIRVYDASRLYGDVVGGLTVGIMNIPQGIAYALLAEIPPVNGLYTTALAGLLFPWVSCWPHASLGPFAVVELMTGAVVRRLENDEATAHFTDSEVASALTFLIGVCHVRTFEWLHNSLQVCVACLRISFVGEYFSTPLVGGFVTGAAVHVGISQANSMLGIKRPKFSGAGYLVKDVISLFPAIQRTNMVTFLLWLCSFLFLAVGKFFINPLLSKLLKKHVIIPFELFVVIIGTIVSFSLDLNGRHDVAVVGNVPRGVPTPELPSLNLFPHVWADAAAITVVMVAVHLSMAKVMCAKRGYRVNDVQEMYAVGMVLIPSSFFPVFPAANGLGRPLILNDCGATSQLANLISGTFILAVLLLLASFFYWLPLLLWMVAFLATVFIDVISGLAVALCFQLLLVVFRVQWPKWSARFSKRKEVADVCLFRFETMLIFCNARLFQRAVVRAMKAWNAHGLGPCRRTFIFDCSALSHVDSAGLKALDEVIALIQNSAATIDFAHATDSLKAQLYQQQSNMRGLELSPSVADALHKARIPADELPVIVSSSTNPFDVPAVSTEL